jgi:formylglycine-generating enzyme required for sulfatase activity
MSTSLSGTGTLRIEVQDACELFLDDEPVGNLQSGEQMSIELLPDTYDVSAEREDGAHWKKQVQVRTETQTTVTVVFEDDVDSPAGASESERIIIRPGQQEDSPSEQRQWSWAWLGVAILLLAGVAAYGAFPEWTQQPVADLAEEVVGTFQSPEEVTTKEDSPLTIQIADTSETTPFVSLLASPSHGTLSFSSDSTAVTYTPDPDFAGRDQFQYTLRNDSRIDTLRRVVQVEAVPDSPRAVDDDVRTEAGESVDLDLLSNDSSPDERPLQLQRIESASGGTLRIDADSTQVTYVPDEGFSGVDTLEYIVADSRGLTDDAIASVKVDEPPPIPADLEIEWTRISAGSFAMGSDRGNSEAQPSHRVEITTPFRMSAYEITVRQFRLFVEATGYRTDAERLGGAWQAEDEDGSLTPGLTWRNPGFEQSSDHPVVCVSWNDAQAFAEWMGGRLPTEAEWEYAARAGVTYPKLPGDWSETTWYAENSEGRTHPVGQKEPNDWGIYDVQGNVWEWVQDWYAPDYYEESPQVDPTGPNSGELRVCRGGSWHDDRCWIPARNRATPTYRANNIGFRVVKPVQESPPS